MQLMTIGSKANAISQFVGFGVENEEYCIEILKVQEIIRMVEITRVPNAAYYLEGIINLRGKVIPVVDFRKRFNLAESAQGNEASRRIIVVALERMTVGIVVDRVTQVVKLEEEQISPAPSAAASADGDAIRGVAKVGEKLVILLDPELLLGAECYAGIAAAA